MKKTLIALGFAIAAGNVSGVYADDNATDSIAVASTAANFAVEGQHLQLSLDDCLTIALSENPSVRVADMDITRVDYSRWETVSQLLPQISFAGTYSRMLEKQVMYMNMDMSSFLPGGGGTGGEGGESAGTEETPASRASKKSDGGIKVGLDNSYQVGFNASLPIIAPQLWASLKITDYQIYEAAEKARASRIDLINSVEKAYYGLMLAIDSRKVLQESYDMAKFTYDLYSKQNKLGAASEFDVLRAQVAMQNIEPSVMQADLAIRQAKLSLLLLMGIDNVDFDITGSLKDYESTMYEDALNIDRDFSDNTSLVQFDIQAKQLDQLIKVEKAAYYPTLAGTAMYNWTSSTNGTPFKWRWNPYSVVGLSLNIPIFTGGKRYARVKEAKIQSEEMSYNRENLTRSLAMQVDVAYDNIKVNIAQIESCVHTVAQATRAHDIMAESFKIGAASYLNLRDSELALTQSQLAYYQAIYNLMVSRSELDKLLGHRAPHTEYKKVKD